MPGSQDGPSWRVEARALMRRLNSEQGITFVFATHDPKVMDAATRVVQMVDGEVAEDIRK